MTTIPFNLNHYLRVRLKPEGYALWKAFDDELLPCFAQPLETYYAKADEQGYVGFQAWWFMRVFGPHIKGYGEPIFELDVLIEIDETPTN